MFSIRVTSLEHYKKRRKHVNDNRNGTSAWTCWIEKITNERIRDIMKIKHSTIDDLQRKQRVDIESHTNPKLDSIGTTKTSMWKSHVRDKANYRWLVS